jgi:4'-phosphopantetheinyl transferase
MVQSLPDDVCHVWWASPSAARPGHVELLDDAENERWQRFRRDDDRARMLVGVALAKTVLAGLLDAAPRDVVFDRSCGNCGQPHGKPRLTGTGVGVHFSTSHSGDRIGVAVATRAPVGVDVENLARVPEPDRLAAVTLTTTELTRWTRLPHERRRHELIRAWTRKESLLKATGDGLALPMSRIGLTDRDGRPALDHWSADAPRPSARLYDLHPGPGYLACLTLLAEQPCRVDERDGDELLHRVHSGVRPHR